MKKLLKIICLISISLQGLAYEIPQFTNYVVDPNQTLTSNELMVLNTMLKEYEDSTSNQIAVLIIPKYDDLAGEGVLFDFSMAVFNSWKIGQTKKDNGVLLVIANELVSKNAPGLRIVTGRGVEGALPDAVCKRIIEKIRPDINNGNYYGGITQALDFMMVALKGEYHNDSNNKSETSMSVIILIFFIIIVVFIIVCIAASGSGSSYSSGGSYSSGSSDSYGDSGGSDFGGGGGGDSGGGGAGD